MNERPSVFEVELREEEREISSFWSAGTRYELHKVGDERWVLSNAIAVATLIRAAGRWHVIQNDGNLSLDDYDSWQEACLDAIHRSPESAV